ncbi:MAG: tagatose-6-phosphate ketose isomerase [Acidobacteriaceae bacterium]|nr:tagatose-6-phosphate ketose isomerase [Acidobacteriaceae bacterium]
MSDLSQFLNLPLQEKKARGLLYTPAEIAQQPATWLTTLQIFEEHQERITAFLEDVGIHGPLESRPTVVLVGAGTSDYIGHALESLLRQKWGCEVLTIASTELLLDSDDYVIAERKYLWISFSRSGDSPEGVAVLEQAIRSYPNIAHLVITCNEQAKMASICNSVRRACVVVLDDAVNDRSLAMTSSFTNMVVMGHCIANAWSIEEYKPLLQQMVSAGERLLTVAAAHAEGIAERRFARICFVGGGSLKGVAMESALKVLEMTAGDIKTMSQSILGLRHGPMAALDQETLFLCFVSSDDRKAKYSLDLLREVGQKQIVAESIAIGPSSLQDEFSSSVDLFIPIEVSVADGYRPVLDVIVGQLIGLYCSVAHGLKPDSPSAAGVISRVVQEFSIH